MVKRPGVQWGFRLGAGSDGIAERHHSLVARHRGHRLDRLIVLFHPSLSQPQEAQRLPAGVKGDAWQVPRDGFYQMIKFMVAPSKMPDELTWFEWRPIRPSCQASRCWWSSITCRPVSYTHLRAHET